MSQHETTEPQCSDTNERYWFQNEPVSSAQGTSPMTDTTAWQSMETAPKTDGKILLIWCRQNGPGLAYYSMAGWTPIAFGDLAMDEEGKPRSFKPVPGDQEPIAWQAITPPPGEEDLTYV